MNLTSSVWHETLVDLIFPFAKSYAHLLLYRHFVMLCLKEMLAYALPLEINAILWEEFVFDKIPKRAWGSLLSSYVSSMF
jgi:hypothetical protein